MLSRFAPRTENMSTENPTVALLGLDQGTLDFVQVITAWDGQGTATFTTVQVRDLATVLCNQNFLEILETDTAATDAVPLIHAEVTQLETELTDQCHSREVRKVAEGVGSQLSGPMGARRGEGSGSR